jgi:hypothetical protein
MANAPIQTVTVDRVSNSGNAIAQQQHAGKTIHVPAGEVGDTHDVRLIDKGGYFVTKLVDRTEEVQPRQPGLTPDTSDVGKDLLNPERNQSHSFEIRSSAPGGSRSTRQERRSWMSQRKM